MTESTNSATPVLARPPAPPGPGGRLAWRNLSVQLQILVMSLAVLVPMLAAIGVLLYRVERMRVAASQVTSTYDALNAGHQLVKQFAEMRMAVHAYALTGDMRFMDQFTRARAAWSVAEASASGSIRRDPAREKRLAEVVRDVETFSEDWDNRLSTFKPGADDPDAKARIEEDEQRMRRISSTIARFVSEEEDAIRNRLNEEEQARNRVFAGALATSLAAVLMLTTFAILLGRSIARPIQQVAEAAERLGAGHYEERVTPRGGRETRILAHAFNEMAEALHQARDSLDARNLELEQFSARLATANEDLRDRQKESEDFLYVLSHDLRAPLINIQGFGKRLQSSMTALEAQLAGAMSDEVRKQLSRMNESLKFVNVGTAKIELLISRLLEIARLTTRPNQHQWIDMDSLAHDVIGACRYQLDERGIEVVVDPLPRVFADPVQINQVVANLVDNAIKYMGDRPLRRIRISCTEQGERYRFAVEDTGPGIDPKDQEKVFRMFTRLAPGASQGEGIGLAAVRTIVNRHGGRIWVESAPGVGSTFYFTLPRSQEYAAA